jgi:hypothetical protein
MSESEDDEASSVKGFNATNEEVKTVMEVPIEPKINIDPPSEHEESDNDIEFKVEVIIVPLYT